mgnify:CR=1 FL=1
MGRVYAVLGDIHANIDALNAVLDDARAQGVTHFVCVGDVVGYNAAPAACIRAVRDELGCPCDLFVQPRWDSIETEVQKPAKKLLEKFVSEVKSGLPSVPESIASIR